ncbi:MAG: F0F1 ATP synthase subunit B [Actinomycetota bacterium]
MLTGLLAASSDTRFILPEKSELLWGSIAFGLVALALIKFVFPMYRKTQAERTARIKGSLEDAESQKTAADKLVEEYRARLANAQAEANRIIEEAKKTAESLKRDLNAKAEAEAQEIVNRARTEVTSEKERAMAELRTNVADLTIKVAEKVIGKELANESAQRAFVDQTITELSRMGS